MQFAKKLLSALGAVLLAALLLVVAAPKTVHALVATLVQVSNTPSNPAITLEEEAQSAFVANTTCSFVTTDCTINSLYSVPENKIAVIESVSDYCYIAEGTTIIKSYLTFTFNQPQSNTMFLAFPPTQPTSFDGSSLFTTALSLKSYAVGTISFVAESDNDQPFGSDCQVTLSGHLE